MTSTLPPGTAPVKPECVKNDIVLLKKLIFVSRYILANVARPVPDDDAAEGSTSHVNGRADDSIPVEGGQIGPGSSRKKWSKEDRKNKRGANKGRRFQKVRDELELCWRVAVGKNCEFGAECVEQYIIWYCSNGIFRCRNSHNVEEYLAAKPRDLRFPPISALNNESPFISSSNEDEAMSDAKIPSIDWSTTCPVFERTGECKHGLRCRFLGGHVRRTDEGTLELVVHEEKKAHTAITDTELNFVAGDTLKQIRWKKVTCLS